ncbi:hypothetical protein HY771_00665 [Candidatus Uhrbacteria bacterium]|nr:hypothetical protein [Candidatus Uhrbacteria bacterium]
MPFTPLRDLLTNAIKRANVSTQVTATQIVAKANEAIDRVLPVEFRTDSKAVSFKDNILTIASAHSSTSQFVSENEKKITDFILSKFPQQNIRGVRYKITRKL